MDKFIFVLGSNWQLSLAELDNVLKNSRYKGKITDYSANVAVVEFEDLQEDQYYVNTLEELQFMLGGCQKIAKIYDFIHYQSIMNAFPFKIEKFHEVKKTRARISETIRNVLVGRGKIFPKAYESMFYAVSIYPILYNDEYYSKVLVRHFLPFLNKEIMEILKSKGAVKALYYKYPEENMKSGNLNPIFPHHVIRYELLKEHRAEIIFGFTEEGVYVARTFTVDNPNFKKKIDEERPFKEFKSSISPKLALMLLNFLNLFDRREDKIILDPFVGNGTIPLFAILQDFQVYGSDIEEEKVRNTIRNINWFLKELEESLPIQLDERFKKSDVKTLSQTFKTNFFDGVCTEPYLGPFYKSKPYYHQVKELIEEKMEPLYDAMFRELSKVLKPSARAVIIAPIISTVDGGDLQINVENLARNHHFKLIPIIDGNRIVNKSNIKLRIARQDAKTLIEAKKGQIVKRKIYVFQKHENS